VATEMVTVLFTDLVESTALMARVGPERAEALRVEHFTLLRAAVADHDGREVKNLGDGLMVVFGTVSRSLDAAVGMQQAMEARNRTADEAMVVRVGVSTGEADVVDGDYFGVPVVEAARLCAAADGGEILVADLLRMLAGGRSGHRFEPVGPLELKGLDGPVVASRVAWEPLSASEVTGSELPARLHRGEGGLFVGRVEERRALDEALKAAEAGDGRRVVLIGGEPGIGKTTLVSEFAAAAHESGTVVTYGRCDEDLSIPFQPWREAMGHLADSGLVEPGALGTLVSAPSGASAATWDPEAERYQLFQAVTRALTSATAGHPVVLVLDDLHWADSPTASLLRHVATTAADARLLVVATYRDAEIAAGHPMADVLAKLHREDGIDRIVLRGLGDDDVLDLLEALAGHSLDVDGLSLRDALRAETDGNPFFTVEILRHLSETGAITQDPTGRWVTTSTLADHGLPTSVREVTGQRVARLGPDTQRVLRLASVIGRDFDLDVLAEVADLDEDRLLDLLEPAEANALIAEIAPARFTFAHALVEHTLYEELSGTRRSRAHRAVAEAIEARSTGDLGARAGELAHHWGAATSPTDNAKAVAYARQAGDYALAALAPEEATRWYQRGLDLLTDQPGDDAETRRARAQLLAGLGSAQRDRGDAAYRDTLLLAGSLAGDVGDTDTLVRAALATNQGATTNHGTMEGELVGLLERALAAIDGERTSRRAQLLAALGAEIHYDDPDHSLVLARQAMGLVIALGDDDIIAWTAARACNAALQPRTLAERREWGRTAQEAAVRSGAVLAAFYANDAAAGSALELGLLDEFDRMYEQRVVLAAQVGRPAARWDNSVNRVNRAMIAGELDTAERLLEESLQLGLTIGAPDAMLRYGASLFVLRDMQGRFPEVLDLLADAARDIPTIAALRAGHALCLIRAGRPAEAREVIAADLDAGFTSVPVDRLWTAAMSVFADAVATLGLRDAAQALFDLIEPFPDQVPTTFTTTYEVFHFALGRLATVVGHYADAEAHFARAHEIHEAMAAPYFLARTRWAWAELLVTRGDPADHAQAHLLATQALDEAAARGFGLVGSDAARVLARLEERGRG
jgi:class 3 adenylate cyclase/tetratricopeptide (TPR) repeat protein